MSHFVERVTGVEGSSFSGKSTLIKEVHNKGNSVSVIPETCDIVGGNRHFRQIPFTSIQEAQLNTHYFLEVEKRRWGQALELVKKPNQQVLMDRITPFSSVMLFALLRNKYPELHGFSGDYEYAVEQYQKALDAGEIFLPNRMIFVNTDPDSFSQRKSRGTSVNPFGLWDTYQFNQAYYHKIADNYYPGDYCVWINSDNADGSLENSARCALDYILGTEQSRIININLKDVFSDAQSEIAPDLDKKAIDQEKNRVLTLMEKAKYEYLKFDEGVALRPGENIKDQEAFRGQVLKTLYNEWGFDYDPTLNYDLDHPDEVYSGKGKWWVLEDNGNIIGTMAVEDHGDRCHWRRLTLDQEYRNRGWGRMLNVAMIKYCQQVGFKTGYFDTIKDTGVYKLYESLGCKIVAEYQEGPYTKVDMEVDLTQVNL